MQREIRIQLIMVIGWMHGGCSSHAAHMAPAPATGVEMFTFGHWLAGRQRRATVICWSFLQLLLWQEAAFRQ